MGEKNGLRVLWIVLAIVAILVSCGFGALVGGLAGYAVGRNASLLEYHLPFRLPGQQRESVPEPDVRVPETPTLPRLPEEPPLFEFRDGGGALIVEVMEDSPAERAGLRVGDLVVAVDERTLDDEEELAERIRQYEPGERVTLTVIRQGRERTIEVTLGRNADDTQAPWLGIRYHTIPAIGGFRFREPDRRDFEFDRWSG